MKKREKEFYGEDLEEQITEPEEQEEEKRVSFK
jgi:hypothetical protein